MIDHELNINLLIIKYVNGSISEDEARILADWVIGSEQNAIYFRTMCRSFEQHLPASADAEAFWNRINDSDKTKQRVAPRRSALCSRLLEHNPH